MSGYRSIEFGSDLSPDGCFATVLIGTFGLSIGSSAGANSDGASSLDVWSDHSDSGSNDPRFGSALLGDCCGSASPVEHFGKGLLGSAKVEPIGSNGFVILRSARSGLAIGRRLEECRRRQAPRRPRQSRPSPGDRCHADARGESVFDLAYEGDPSIRPLAFLRCELERANDRHVTSCVKHQQVRSNFVIRGRRNCLQTVEGEDRSEAPCLTYNRKRLAGRDQRVFAGGATPLVKVVSPTSVGEFVGLGGRLDGRRRQLVRGLRCAVRLATQSSAKIGS